MQRCLVTPIRSSRRSPTLQPPLRAISLNTPPTHVTPRLPSYKEKEWRHSRAAHLRQSPMEIFNAYQRKVLEVARSLGRKGYTSAEKVTPAQLHQEDVVAATAAQYEQMTEAELHELWKDPSKIDWAVPPPHRKPFDTYLRPDDPPGSRVQMASLRITDEYHEKFRTNDVYLYLKERLKDCPLGASAAVVAFRDSRVMFLPLEHVVAVTERLLELFDSKYAEIILQRKPLVLRRTPLDVTRMYDLVERAVGPEHVAECVAKCPSILTLQTKRVEETLDTLEYVYGPEAPAQFRSNPNLLVLPRIHIKSVLMEVRHLFMLPAWNVSAQTNQAKSTDTDGGKVALLLGGRGRTLWFTTGRNIRARMSEVLHSFGRERGLELVFRAPKVLTVQRHIISSTWATMQSVLGPALALELVTQNPNVLALGPENFKWSLASFEEAYCGDLHALTEEEVAREYPKRIVLQADVIAEPESVLDSEDEYRQTWKEVVERETKLKYDHEGLNDDNWVMNAGFSPDSGSDPKTARPII